MKKALATIIISAAAAGIFSAPVHASSEAEYITISAENDQSIWPGSGKVVKADYKHCSMWIRSDRNKVYYAPIDPEDLNVGDKVLFIAYNPGGEYDNAPESVEIIRVIYTR